MNNTNIDLGTYKSNFSIKNRLLRVIWNILYYLVFRPFIPNIFNGWRVQLLRLFGAKIGKNTIVYSSSKIWAPWNLEIGVYSCIGPDVDCYNQGKIRIGNHSIISQKVYLCASTHDFSKPNFPLIKKTITICDQVWIAADAFIGPGTIINDGVVVGACSAVFKDVESWSVVGGNPAKYLKKRIIINDRDNGQ